MNRKSLNALTRLRSHIETPSIWGQLPYQRRAAVLLLLYQDANEQLNAVITMRSDSLRSFSGHAALPGGKADFEQETCFQVSRREACEEIGFPSDDSILRDQGYQLDYLTTLPCYLSRNLLAVRPVVAFLSSIKSHKDPYHDCMRMISSNFKSHTHTEEVQMVFHEKLEKFLSNEKGWYTGTKACWGGIVWHQHWFQVLRGNKKVGDPSHYT